MSIDMELIQRCRLEIMRTATRMLRAEFSYIEGSRAILKNVVDARVDPQRSPFAVFAAIASETDLVPIRAERDLWASAAIARVSAEWEAAEKWARQYGEQACQETIWWLERNPVDFASGTGRLDD